MKHLPFILISLFLASSVFAYCPTDKPGCEHRIKKQGRVLFPSQKNRLSLDSGWFYVNDEDIELHLSYSGWDPQLQKRVSNLNIGDKALDMIRQADNLIVASAFLFDNMYSTNPQIERDIVGEFVNTLIAKKQENPDIRIALIFDHLQRAYERRQAPAIKKLREYGIDIFYSDLLTTKAHTPIKIIEAGHHTMRVASQIFGGLLAKGLKQITTRIPIPFAPKIDNHPTSLQTALNAALVKANHRKLLVTDTEHTYEALVSSANPHNASLPSTNSAISVKGNLALYIYEALRQDIKQSIFLGGKDYVSWHKGAPKYYKKNFLTKVLTGIDIKQLSRGEGDVKVKFVTEIKIKEAIIEELQQVKPGDEIRIQMFYLSDLDVIKAIINASAMTNQPVRLLLDPNKDAFGVIKDGTPNRQVATLLMSHISTKDAQVLNHYYPEIVSPRGMRPLSNVEVKWFNTTGEQNHAKIMSITNKMNNKYVLINGSANWTGKNLKDINMEANLVVHNALTATGEFNSMFDLFYDNQDGRIYSLDYEHEVYSQHAGMRKWLNGESLGFVTW